MLPQDDHCDKEDLPPLLVDAMLGRLARWLRLMGYDTLYWREGSDAALAERARAEGRLLLTRDHQLAGRRGVKALLVTAETLDEQLAEVRAALGGRPRPFTRCPECNERLEELAHEAARARPDLRVADAIGLSTMRRMWARLLEGNPLAEHGCSSGRNQ
jgi:uncharacterized protein with PIN domain